jgi:hypothetical protein
VLKVKVLQGPKYHCVAVDTKFKTMVIKTRRRNQQLHHVMEIPYRGTGCVTVGKIKRIIITSSKFNPEISLWDMAGEYK